MLESQRIELRLVELRSAIAAFPADGESTDLEKLTTEYRAADVRRAASLITESADADAARAAGDLDAGQREVDAIGSGVGFGDYISAAVEMRSANGAAGEWNAAHGMSPRQFPLSILAPVQMRQTTGTDGQVNQQRWLDRLFATSAAARLGITMESVPAGVATYMTTTAGATGAQRAKSQAAAAGAYAIGVQEMKPKRNAVHLVYNIEDAARLPGLGDALRRDMGMELMQAVDKAIFVGDATATGTDADITGLTTYAALTESEITQANSVLGPGTLEAFTALVDGLAAQDLGDLNVVASVGAYRLWANTIINSAADNMTMAQFLMASGMSYGSRAGIDTATANGDFGAFVGRARGIEGAGVAAMWDAGSLIYDEITGASEGEIKMTLNYLWDFDLPRASNFARVKFVT